MKKQPVHKFKNDNPKATFTACGLGAKRPGLLVNADARKATCGNCQRVPTAVIVSSKAKK